MCRIGIDVGSTYTKYCIREGGKMNLYEERTPIRQREYFTDKLWRLQEKYPRAIVVSCGYGRKNITGIKQLNELTALAKGVSFVSPESEVVLDIGGQDTKVICQRQGVLKEFFVNDRCAAGSGIFFWNTTRLLEIPIGEIDLTYAKKPEIHLSSVCAVFAQSEITRLLAENTPVDEILRAVVWQILTQARALLGKVKQSPVLLSGGLTKIKGINQYAKLALEQDCTVPERGSFLSALGCTLLR